MIFNVFGNFQLQNMYLGKKKKNNIIINQIWFYRWELYNIIHNIYNSHKYGKKYLCSIFLI